MVLGPGTGLGVACYLPGPGPAMVLPSEGGHATMPPSDAREMAVIGELQKPGVGLVQVIDIKRNKLAAPECPGETKQ